MLSPTNHRNVNKKAIKVSLNYKIPLKRAFHRSLILLNSLSLVKTLSTIFLIENVKKYKHRIFHFIWNSTQQTGVIVRCVSLLVTNLAKMQTCDSCH